MIVKNLQNIVLEYFIVNRGCNCGNKDKTKFIPKVEFEGEREVFVELKYLCVECETVYNAQLIVHEDFIKEDI